MQHPYEIDLKITTGIDSLPTVISEINSLNIDNKLCNKMEKTEEQIVISFNKKIYISNRQKRRKLISASNITTNIISNKRKFEEI